MSEHEDQKPPGLTRLEGRYANHYRVGYNVYEFVIDFGQFYDGEAEEYFHTRIVTSPRYAREMLEALSEALMAYKANYGSIRDDH